MTQSLPLSSYDTFHSTDLDAVRRYLGGIFCPHSLDLLQKCTLVDTHLHHARVAEMSVVYLDYGAPVDIYPGTLDNFYLIQIVLSGKAEVSLDNTDYTAQPGQATIINPTSFTRIRATEDCSFLSIKLDCKRVATRLEEHLRMHLDAPLIFQSKLDLRAPKSAAIYRYINYMVTELEMGILEDLQPSTHDHFETMLTSMLLDLQPHNYCGALSEHKSIPAQHYVRKAEAYMRENLGSVISPDELAAVTEVTPRTLCNGFHRYHQTTPMGYLKSLRLERVHHDLRSAGHGDTITRIAMNCGITHLGRFSSEYRKRFGEAPSQTLKIR